jgi:hypothetical protein
MVLEFLSAYMGKCEKFIVIFPRIYPTRLAPLSQAALTSIDRTGAECKTEDKWVCFLAIFAALIRTVIVKIPPCAVIITIG